MNVRKLFLDHPVIPLKTYEPFPIPGEPIISGKCPDDLLEEIRQLDVFEFEWLSSGIELCEDFLPYFPFDEEEDLPEGMKCPLPHDKIWIETSVPSRADNVPRKFCWFVRYTPEGHWAITPFVVNYDWVMVYGATAILDPMFYDPASGDRGSIWMDYLTPRHSNSSVYHNVWCMVGCFLRFLRCLNLPGTEVRLSEPAEKVNRIRLKKGKAPIPERRVVHIGGSAQYRSHANTNLRQHKSPAEHFRRAHLRRLSDGRVVKVRSCLVNGSNGTDAVPQRFSVA